MTNKTFLAKIESLNEVICFVEEMLSRFDCPLKMQMGICVAIEEVFVNIAHYAYPNGEGNMTLGVDFDKQSSTVTFRVADKGVPFDPLKKPDPDITLSLEERQIGGLGIFITNKTMDVIGYAYENGENILTMMKKI